MTDSINAILHKANHHYSLCEYWHALKNYKQILALLHNFPDKIAGYGFSLLYTEQIDDALLFFKAAVKGCPSKLLLDGLGWTLLANHSYSQADRAFSKSLEYTNDWNSLRELAKAKQGLGHYTEALNLEF
jgi:tetratricopeptide (TPR) repeat protein